MLEGFISNKEEYYLPVRIPAMLEQSNYSITCLTVLKKMSLAINQ